MSASPLLPSVVRYGADGVIAAGQAAKAKLVDDPHNTIASVKRLVGRHKDEVLAEGTVPYTLDQDGNVLRIQTAAGGLTAVEYQLTS